MARFVHNLTARLKGDRPFWVAGAALDMAHNAHREACESGNPRAMERTRKAVEVARDIYLEHLRRVAAR